MCEFDAFGGSHSVPGNAELPKPDATQQPDIENRPTISDAKVLLSIITNYRYDIGLTRVTYINIDEVFSFPSFSPEFYVSNLRIF